MPAEQTLPACDPDDPLADTVGKSAGFSLHAGVAAKARERDKLERLCRYITRPAEHPAAMTPDQVRGRLWVQRLKRVFNIDMQTCSACGGAVKVIACIEDSAVIEKILAHLNEKALPVQAPPLPKCRAPPQSVLFD